MLRSWSYLDEMARQFQDDYSTIKVVVALAANGRSIQVTGLAWSLAIIDCSRNVGKIVTDKHKCAASSTQSYLDSFSITTMGSDS
jgi:hypothetical protein